MVSAFDYDQTLRVAGRLVELSPLVDRDDRVVRPMRDQGRAFHFGHLSRRFEAVLRQEVQFSGQPRERDRAHVARRTQARFDDQRRAREARREVDRRGRSERLAVQSEFISLHAALAHEVDVNRLGVGIEPPFVRQAALAATVASVIKDHYVESARGQFLRDPDYAGQIASVAVAMEYGRNRGLVFRSEKPPVDALDFCDLHPHLFAIRWQRPIRPRDVRLRMVGHHEFEAPQNKEKNHDYYWQIDQHANPSWEPGGFSWFRGPGFHDSGSAELMVLSFFQIDHRIDSDPGKGEFSRVFVIDEILRLDASDSESARLGASVIAAQPQAQPVDLAPAVIQQAQSRARAVAGEATDHRLGPVNAQAAVFVAEHPANLLREPARVGRLRLRILFRAEFNVDAELGRGGRDDVKEQIAAREQVHDLARLRRFVVDDADIADRRVIIAGQVFNKSEHRARFRQIGRVELQDRVGIVSERLGDRHRRLALRQIVVELARRVAGESPAVSVDPGAARRRSHVGPPGDAGGEKFLAAFKLGLAYRDDFEPGPPPRLGLVRRRGDPFNARLLQRLRRLDSSGPVDQRYVTASVGDLNFDHRYGTGGMLSIPNPRVRNG